VKKGFGDQLELSTRKTTLIKVLTKQNSSSAGGGI